MALRDTIRHALTRSWPTTSTPARSFPTLDWDEFVSYFQFGNFLPFRQTLSGNVEETSGDFAGLVTGAYQNNGVVFACMLARMMLFSEARFQFQQLRGGRPGDLFGNAELAILERPWPGATTGDLLTRAITDVDLAGNFYAVRRPNRIKRLRPDWVDIILGSETDADVEAGDIDAEVVAYVYHPGGRHSGREPQLLLREQVAHFAPIPDPLATFRGMSWLVPILREIQGDTAATRHKVKFFENGATPNLVVTVDLDDDEKFNRWVEAFDIKHKGLGNAYKTLYLMSGTTVDVKGSDFKQMDFKVTQGAGETRIAAASGIHPTIIGLSEGLQGSSLNEGNFGAARRLTADKTMRPLWRNLAGSLETIIPVAPGSRLWYDDRDIPFLAEDIKDAAEVQGLNASAMRQLVDGGFTPLSVVDAVTSGDLRRLVHTGLFSVQLQPPGTVTTPEPPAPRSSELGVSEFLRLAMSNRQQPSVVNINEGAIRSETPVTVSPAPVSFHEGAFHSETRVEPTTVTFEDGAIRADSPVTVEPAQVTIEEGAVQVDAPVTVEPAQVTIAEGAIRSDTPVTVNTPEVTVERQDIHVEPTPITVENRVDPAPVTVENRVEVSPTPIENRVEVNPTPVTVENKIEAPKEKRATGPQEVVVTQMPDRIHRAKRDAKGRIQSSTETDA